MSEQPDDMDKLEMKQSLRNIAELTRELFVALVAEGFTEAQALPMATEWMVSLNKSSDDGEES